MPDVLRLSTCTVDLARGRISSGDAERGLSTKEAAVLRYLAERPGQDVSREDLYREVWGHSRVLNTRTLDVTVRRLRMKIERDSSEPDHVVTVQGTGYRFEGSPVTEQAGRTNMDAAFTSFVGRQDDLAELRALFEQGARLVTILGTAGVGKTRLSRHYALEAAGRMPGGSWFCDLTAASSSADVLAVVAEVLEVQVGTHDPDHIGRALAARGRLLLVLDNLEQLADEVTPLVQAWLRQAPDARILATSQAPLHLGSEVQWSLDPLPTADAVHLFTERARTAHRGFDPDAHRETLQQIVEALDCNPLAIELAAARIGVLPPAGLLQRLSERFGLLRQSRADIPRRRSTLYGAIDWSWSLLSPAEQSALAQAAVFVGGFDLDAAEAVLDDPDVDVLDLLDGLVQRSLVTASEGTEASAGYRFGMYESIRAYALAKLDDRAAVERRHGAWYLGLAETSARDAQGRQGRASIHRLAREAGNIIAVVNRESEPQQAARAALALRPLFESRGPFATYLGVLAAGLEAARRADDPDLQAALLSARASFHYMLGDLEAAQRSFAEAQGQAQHSDNPAVLGRLLGDWGVLLLEEGDTDEAWSLYLRALAAIRRAGDRAGEGICLGRMGNLHHLQGRLEQAQAAFEEALLIHREVGNRRAEGNTLSNLGALQQELGRSGEALTTLREAVAIHREEGNQRSEARTLTNIGVALTIQDRLDEAEEVFYGALSLNRRIGHRAAESGVLLNLGVLSFYRRDMADARHLFASSARIYSEIGNRPGLTFPLRALGIVSLAEWRTDEAAKHLERAYTIARECSMLASATFSRGLLAAALAACGRTEESEVTFRRALRRARECDDGGLLLAVELLHAFPLIVERRALLRAGQALEAALLLERIRAQVEPKRTVAERDSDSRSVLHLIDLVLEAEEES